VVLGHTLWQRRFGSDPRVVGRAVTLNAQPFTVIGVAPPGFRGSVVGLALEAFVPLSMQRELRGGGDLLAARGARWLAGVGRLRPGTDIRAAEAQLQAVSRRLVEGGLAPKGGGVALHTFWDTPTGGARVLRPVLLVLAGVVALVLLIACANVANLLLARATGRRREVALRLSLGASRARLVRQLLTESVLLALLGGAAGLLVAAWSTGLLMAFTPPSDLPIALTPRVDAAALLVTFALSCGTGLLFGLVPALQASRADQAGVLRDESAAVVGGRGRQRLRAALVAGQVALSLVLLVAATLLLRSLYRAHTLSPGFETRGVLLASLDLQGGGYTPQTGAAFWRALWPRLRHLPGATGATFTRRAPLGLGGTSTTTVNVEGYAAPDGQPAWAHFHAVGPEYFRTLGARLVAGRDFTEADAQGAPRVAVVSETMARRYWGKESPLGRRLELRRGEWWTVVGVAAEAKDRQLTEPAVPHLFVPVFQQHYAALTLLVRAAGDPRALAPAVSAQVRGLDPALPVYEVRTLAEHARGSSFPQRLGGSLLAVFGVLALALAAIGLYGVLAYSVGQRTREIGIRVALGAAASDVFRMVMRQGVAVAAVGVVLGLLAALPAARALRALLVGVGPWDPLSFAVVTAALLAAAAAACAVPARRATRVDPAVALRAE
jgi:predicted permease